MATATGLAPSASGRRNVRPGRSATCSTIAPSGDRNPPGGHEREELVPFGTLEGAVEFVAFGSTLAQDVAIARQAFQADAEDVAGAAQAPWPNLIRRRG